MSQISEKTIRHRKDAKLYIEDYWTKRSPEFIKLRREELHSEKYALWQKEICSYFPPGKALKILDVGCGAGFFSILLGKQGHEVTGIDLTESMIADSRVLAEEEGCKAEFLVMDAENLQFPDGTFDVVVSRNVTWNLPHPAKAYAEWVRVLKPGGLLLNFDANWYTYLYEEAAKEAYMQDRINSAKQGVGDQNIGEGFDVMEKIARHVPLSAIRRPAWDVERLSGLGLRCSVDEKIWQRVWSEEEKLNFASTPMFLVRAQK